MTQSGNNPFFIYVDDDVDDREIFKECMDDLFPNIQLNLFEDGIQLINYLEGLGFKLPRAIFLDLNMPKMNGFECLSKIREDVKYNQVKVLIYSTSSSESDRIRCTDLGADCFLTKSSSYGEIKKRLNGIILGLLDPRLSA